MTNQSNQVKRTLAISALVVLGCSSPKVLTQGVPQSDLEDGFLSRLEKFQPSPRAERKVGINLLTASPRSELETLRVIDNQGNFCAAIAIASRLAVTALHCAQAMCPQGNLVGCKVNYEESKGTVSSEAVVASVSESDLLVLLNLQHKQPFGNLTCDNPRDAQPVYTVGHPDGAKWETSFGHLTNEPITVEWVRGDSTKVLVAEIPTKRGSSGGGLFDRDSNIIGVQVARWPAWTKGNGKAAFIQANRVYSFAGRYCKDKGSTACEGLQCKSNYYDIWAR